jgi:hypothetical protein
MGNLIIPKTNKTPEINFSVNGKLSISGRGMAEDPKKFYKPVVEWVDRYLENPSLVNEISISLEYIQTGDVRIIMDILRKFSLPSNKNLQLVIKWYYEKDDHDQKEMGESLSRLINMPIQLIELA